MKKVILNWKNIFKNCFDEYHLKSTAFEVFQVPNKLHKLKVRLTDNRNASIPKPKFRKILMQFRKSSSFFVSIDFVDAPTVGLAPSIVTPEVNM